jgi:hypothetical protein
MFKFRTGWLLPLALLVIAALAIAVGQRVGPSMPDASADDGNIPRLLAYLNESGLGLRMIATRKEGGLYPSAFLTTTDKEWTDLNHLPKDPTQINRWRGTLYCEQGPGGDAWSDLARQWGDCCLISGSFLFFGDPELLACVRDVLTEPGGARRRMQSRINRIFRSL